MNIVIGKTLAHARGLIKLLGLNAKDWSPVSVETEYAIRGLTVSNVILAAELSDEQERDLRVAWRDRGFVLKYQERDDFLADTHRTGTDEAEKTDTSDSVVTRQEITVPVSVVPGVLHITVELLK